MNQRLQEILFSIASLGLAIASWIFGVSLIPSSATAQEDGIIIPWVIIWAMIWLTSISALALAAFLLGGANRRSE
jgi:hypothetical protein